MANNNCVAIYDEYTVSAAGAGLREWEGTQRRQSRTSSAEHRNTFTATAGRKAPMYLPWYSVVSAVVGGTNTCVPCVTVCRRRPA